MTLSKKPMESLLRREHQLLCLIKQCEQELADHEAALREVRNQMDANKDDSSSAYCREGRKPNSTG